jgi:hypothetical protein
LPIRVGTGTKNMVPGLREVSLEVFLLSLCSVSGFELPYLACRIIYLPIRVGTKNMVPRLREVSLEVLLLSFEQCFRFRASFFFACRIVTCRFV